MATYAEVFQFLLAQQRNASGLIDSGTVYFYDPGTTNVKTVWDDRDKNTEADNPKTLSADGTAEVYGDGTYRVLIKDSDGTTVYDIDGVQLGYDAQAAATTSASGIVELATATETATGTDSTRVVTPAGLKTALKTLRALGAIKQMDVYVVGDSPATWTKPTDCNGALVIGIAGGGGGGAVTTADTAAQVAGSGGGGGGFISLITSGLGSSETVTVGAGGAGATTTGAAGSSGGDTSFGSHATAGGGYGGQGASSSTQIALPGFGGDTATGNADGDILIRGESADYGTFGYDGTNLFVLGGKPGSGALGLGGAYRGSVEFTSGITDGLNSASGYGEGYGSGGAGGVKYDGTSIAIGGDGAGGLCIVLSLYGTFS